MTTLTLSVLVSRESLTLSDLQINDHSNYIVAGPEFLGGTVAWDKTRVSSPYMDGDVITHMRKGNVQEQVVVEVLGTDIGDLKTNLKVLVDAFSQMSYLLKVSINSEEVQYICEPADYKIVSSTPRYAAKQLQVGFTVTRLPYLFSGVI